MKNSMRNAMSKKVIIVGAGFAGLALAKKLKNQPFDVLLLDRNNYHVFQPLLYQVATGGLEPDSIAYPIRRILRGIKNVRFQMTEVQGVDAESGTLVTSSGALNYDILVLALGSTSNYFNFEPIKAELMALKSITDALDMRSYLMQNLEKAISTNSQEERTELMNIAVIGGGPAGAELAGALAEMRRHVLPKDFPQIDFSKMIINLYEMGGRLLPTMSEKSSAKSLEYLQKMGVEVKLNAKVNEYKDQTVHLDDGSEFPTDTVIWTAGVKANKIEGLNSATYMPNQRLVVDDCFKVKGVDNIYAIGDAAAQVSESLSRGDPQLAAVAIVQGKHLAKNLIALEQNCAATPFHYHHKGSMATIGRNKAVADLSGAHFSGIIAWFIWMFVHIMSLVGFRNKLVTLVDWIQNYFFYDRPLGLIIRPFRVSTKIKPESEE